MKKLMALLITFAMIMAMCSCAVMAEETAPAENETVEAAAKDASNMTDEEIAEWMAEIEAEMNEYFEDDGETIANKRLEKLYSAEVPEEFYLIPKEKMVIEGWDWDFSTLHDKINRGELSWEMFNPLYAYIAIVVNHDYLGPKEISLEDFKFDFLIEDLDTMKEYYSSAIRNDQLSENLAESYSKYDLAEFKGDAELTECIMRAIYTFCITAGVEPVDFWSAHDFEVFYGITPDKITFSEEQLNYFE